MENIFLETAKSVLKILLLVLGFSGAVFLGIAWLMDNDTKKRTATAQPEIMSVEPRTHRGFRSRTEYSFYVCYRFLTASGQTVEAFDDSYTYKPKAEFRVCYDPKDPSNSQLRLATRNDCDKGFLF